MFDSIVYSLGYGNHYIAIHIVIQLKAFFCIVDKAFDHSNVLQRLTVPGC